MIIRNGQFGGKYIFKTDYFDIQIANIDHTKFIQDKYFTGIFNESEPESEQHCMATNQNVELNSTCASHISTKVLFSDDGLSPENFLNTRFQVKFSLIYKSFTLQKILWVYYEEFTNSSYLFQLPVKLWVY